MNVDNLELTMEEIYEIVTGYSKDTCGRTISYSPVLREHVLRLPISGHDFFGKYVWNCKTLIDNGIFDRYAVEKYVSEKIKFMLCMDITRFIRNKIEEEE